MMFALRALLTIASWSITSHRKAARKTVGPGDKPAAAPRANRSLKSITAHSTFVVLILLVLLGGIGVVNGLWSKNLVISGSVETGDLNADWDKIETKDVCERTTVVVAGETDGQLAAQGATSGGWHDEDDHDSVDPCPPPPCDDDGHYNSLTNTGGGYGGGGDSDCNPCDDNGHYNSLTNTGGGGGGGGDNACNPCDDNGHYNSLTNTGDYGGGGGGDDCNPCDDNGHYNSLTNTGGYGGGGDNGDHDDDCVVPPACDAEIGGQGDDEIYGNQVAYIHITNAAPGYWCKIKASITNTGSVPFNVIGIQEVLDGQNGDGISFYDLNSSGSGVCKLVDADGNPRPDKQIDPGASATVYCKVLIDKDEKVCKKWIGSWCKEWAWEGGAEFGWTYHFAVEVCVAQWNEDPSTGNAAADFNACKNPPIGTHEGPDTPVLPTPGPMP